MLQVGLGLRKPTRLPVRLAPPKLRGLFRGTEPAVRRIAEHVPALSISTIASSHLQQWQQTCWPCSIHLWLPLLGKTVFEMKRLSTSLSKPGSTLRRVSLIEETVTGCTSCCRRRAPFLGLRQQDRRISSQASRPRTALFFPGMELS